MTCQEFWDQKPELADEAGPFEHARECPACAGLLERQRALTAGLKRIREDDTSLVAGDAVEARLVAAFRAQMRAASSFSPRRWLVWVSATAAVLALSVLLIRLRIPEGAPAPVVGNPQTAAVQGANEMAGLDSDFVPLLYGAAGESDAGGGEEEDLVRVEVPRSALIALGLPMTTEGGPGRVEAVVALGADGMLRGVRVLQ